MGNFVFLVQVYRAVLSERPRYSHTVTSATFASKDAAQYWIDNAAENLNAYGCHGRYEIVQCPVFDASECERIWSKGK